MDNFALTRQDTSVMKGIAICAMVCHHLYFCPEMIGDGIAPYTGVQAWLGVLCKVCVALFLFCSGYGLSANYKPQSILDDIKFIARRLVKFYINYWVIFIIFVPISIFIFHRTLTDAYGDDVSIGWCFIKDILGLQGFESYNVTWWFNRLIILLYILFPILYGIIRKQPIVAILVSILIARLENHLLVSSVEIYTWQLPFVLGISWQLNENKYPKIGSWLSDHKWLFAVGSITLLIATIVVRMYPIIPHWGGMRMDGFIACAIALCMISIMRYSRYANATLAFIGKHSMNIYLTHTFFNMYWYSKLLHGCEHMRGGGNFLLLMTICLLISIAIEWIKNKIGVNTVVSKLTKKL